MSDALRRAEPLLLIAVGGFAGATCWYLLDGAVPAGFPWGTLAVNVLGSFLLGVLLYENRLVGVLSTETRLVLGTGFLSSFTTYSTFAVETSSLAPPLAAANVAANYTLGLLAFLLGLLTAGPFGTVPTLALGVGFCGAFTTFSTFAFETVRLAEEGETRRAATNGATNLVGALLAVGLGAGVATLL